MMALGPARTSSEHRCKPHPPPHALLRSDVQSVSIARRWLEGGRCRRCLRGRCRAAGLGSFSSRAAASITATNIAPWLPSSQIALQCDDAQALLSAIPSPEEAAALLEAPAGAEEGELFARSLMFKDAKQQLMVIDTVMSFPTAAACVVQACQDICRCDHHASSEPSSFPFMHRPHPFCRSTSQRVLQSCALPRGLRSLLDMHNSLNELAGRSKVRAIAAFIV